MRHEGANESTCRASAQLLRIIVSGKTGELPENGADVFTGLSSIFLVLLRLKIPLICIHPCLFATSLNHVL